MLVTIFAGEIKHKLEKQRPSKHDWNESRSYSKIKYSAEDETNQVRKLIVDTLYMHIYHPEERNSWSFREIFKVKFNMKIAW